MQAMKSYAFQVDPYDDYFFEGLGRQNMSFHHALGELIDNSIAASPFPFLVDVYLVDAGEGIVTVKVSDSGSGIALKDLTSRALKLGGRPISGNRLNEHGFGLKNALCSFTGNKLKFCVQTRDAEAFEAGVFHEVVGPFKREMTATERPSSEWPPEGMEGSGTVVTVDTTLAYLQGVQQTRGPKATNLATLTKHLREHLGVMYRGFLRTLIPGQGKAQGRIRVHQGGDTHDIEGLEVPMNSIRLEQIPFTAGGTNYTATYRHGVLDEAVRDSGGFSIYYQGTIPTQGIDVAIGGRTIAVHQLDEIWDVQRHNKYNNFVGQLVIPEEVPRDYLRSINNKSAYDIQDDIWQTLFHELDANFPPPVEARAQSEREQRDKLADNLKKYRPEDEIVTEYAVWQSAVKIDIST